MRFVTGAALALSLALPAHAETDREARLAVARDYVEASMADMNIQEFIRQIWQPMVQQMAANRQALSPAQVADIEALFSEELTAPLTEVMRRQDENLAEDDPETKPQTHPPQQCIYCTITNSPKI